jgi:hypothetical protein
MNKNLTSLFLILLSFCSIIANAQWSKTKADASIIKKNDNSVYYKLDLNQIKMQLLSAKKVDEIGNPVTIEIPNSDGKLERFAVSSFPVMDEAMAKQYQLGSYVGTGIDDPTKYIRFSVGPNDFQSMMISNGKTEFIEPSNIAKTIYSLHSKSNKNGHSFVCNTLENPETTARIQKLMDNSVTQKANNQKYHTLRLAMAVTGEYTTYFGGTTGALTQINATLTRVNGVFEQEFNLHLNLISAPNLIFTSGLTDPFSAASQMCKWNNELMNVLHGGTYGVTDADYDIGHLFGASGGGGNAGCIGCIGSNDVTTTTYTASSGGCGYAYTSPDNYKGSGFTSPADAIPMGDTFDIDYVAHEMGHQLGGNHTYSFNEGTTVTVEPGSGSTIMGYAGITGANTDVQSNSDPYFHSVSIDQVQAVLAATTVDTETTIANNTPVVTAMPTSYTIPKSTAFVLTGVATDPDSDPLTYCWEQVDKINLANGVGKASGTGDGASAIGAASSGGSFRSWSPVSNPTRYFPKLATVLGGAVKNVNDFEATSSVARTTNFRFTVRDNKPAGQAQTAFANQTIVIGSAAAFTVSPASGNAGSPVTITWVVSGTTASPYNATNVKIDYTNDNGTTWNVLSSSTANSGTASVTFPSALGASTPYVRVSAIGNVFYAVNKVTLSAPLQTSEIGHSNDVQIYPNPATDIIYVKNVSPKSNYTIHDASGRLVDKGTVNNGEISINNLVKGVYVISFNNEGTATKSKFIKE